MVPVLLPKLEELQIRGRREEAHIRSVGGATICCLYLSGEPSEHESRMRSG